MNPEQADNQQIEIIIVTGPTAAGKTFVKTTLSEQYPEKLMKTISYTSRKPRDGEQHGVDYWFVSKKVFLQMIADDAFLEFEEIHGNLYGTPKLTVSELGGKKIILAIDPKGACKLLDTYKRTRVFWLSVSEGEMRKRLAKRDTAEEEIVKRLKTATKERRLLLQRVANDQKRLLWICNEDISKEQLIQHAKNHFKL
jgi:guanylate kinase